MAIGAEAQAKPAPSLMIDVLVANTLHDPEINILPIIMIDEEILFVKTAVTSTETGRVVNKIWTLSQDLGAGLGPHGLMLALQHH